MATLGRRWIRAGHSITVLALALTACEEAVTTPPPPLPAEIALLTEHQWAGGEILIESDDFLRMVIYQATDDSNNVIESRWANLLVLSGEDTLPTRRVDGTTIAATLPRVANGSRSVTVVMDMRTEEIGDVRTYGFAGMLRGPMVGGRQLQFPRPGSLPQVLVYGADAVLLVDLATMDASPVLPYTDFVYDPRPFNQEGPGWSYRSGGAVVERYVWLLSPNAPAQLVDTLTNTFHYAMAELGPGRWVGMGPNWIMGYPGLGFMCAANGNDFAVSPRGDRWTPMGYTACPLPFGWTPGDPLYEYAWPVFDENNEVVYAVGRRPDSPFMHYFTAFSVTGDTLFVGMRTLPNWYDGGELQVLRSADGERLAAVPLEHKPLYVAVDPTRPWIYVAAQFKNADENWVPTMMVVDRRTMKVVGMPTVPDESGLGSSWAIALAAYVADDAVYLSDHGGGSYQITSWRFDLMPPGVGEGVAVRGQAASAR